MGDGGGPRHAEGPVPEEGRRRQQHWRVDTEESTMRYSHGTWSQQYQHITTLEPDQQCGTDQRQCRFASGAAKTDQQETQGAVVGERRLAGWSQAAAGGRSQAVRQHGLAPRRHRDQDEKH